MILLENGPFKLLFTDKTLSLSWKTDEPEKVKENWLRVKRLLGIPQLKIAYLSQVHASTIKTVTDYGFQGWGDGLISSEEGIALVIFTADCIPILFYEEDSQLFGALHCGWKPLASGLIENLLEKVRLSGINPKKLKIYLGPGINSCCYRVGKDLAEQFKGYERFFTARNGSLYCHLKGIIKEKLKRQTERIYDINICTKCSGHYFSHRKGDRERQIGLIVKLPK